MASPGPSKGPLNPSYTRSAEYSYRAPSPPFIHIPVVDRSQIPFAAVELMPSFDNIDPTHLTSQDLQVITQNATQLATDRIAEWSYENRRQAQPIVDFLYLGPTSVIRDHKFLMSAGITMMLIVRDARMSGTKLLSVDKATDALNITAHYVDVDGPQDLIRSFPETIRLINNHLLSVYNSQSRGRNDDGQILIETSEFLRGKVLITCDSGNDRSAALAAAYIMAVFRQRMVSTVQFIGTQRFCCTFDEGMKRILQSWEDILLARSSVAQDSQRLNSLPDEVPTEQTGFKETQPPRLSSARAERSKRGLDDMLGVCSDDDRDGANTDIDRFTDREPFVPFGDLGGLDKIG